MNRTCNADLDLPHFGGCMFASGMFCSVAAVGVIYLIRWICGG